MRSVRTLERGKNQAQLTMRQLATFRQMKGRCVRKETPWGFGDGESTRLPEIKDYKRLNRTMERRGWSKLITLGETDDGTALVFLAVPR